MQLPGIRSRSRLFGLPDNKLTDYRRASHDVHQDLIGRRPEFLDRPKPPNRQGPPHPAASASA